MKKLIKQINNLIDLLQEEIESIKNSNDFEKFSVMAEILEDLKSAKKHLLIARKKLEGLDK